MTSFFFFLSIQILKEMSNCTNITPLPHSYLLHSAMTGEFFHMYIHYEPGVQKKKILFAENYIELEIIMWGRNIKDSERNQSQAFYHK